MRRSQILDVGVQLVFHTLLVVSLYFLLAGHDRPGGGFAGGLVASSAVCLCYVAGGDAAVRATVRVRSTTLLGAGLMLAALTAVVPLVAGQQALQSNSLKADLALVGTVKLSSVLVFDSGVYLVVVGMVLLLLGQLGAADGEPR